ncbi:uncharacterized protein PRCAT00000483001 [Priceomyces carsonii]|uniref:uncharacterized protein n=1 Tax=Priceomyces carsonii TaxID=28549 RepID=UPI002ED88789|nr:unnamed protein product [Priceomyces carsonii]
MNNRLSSSNHFPLRLIALIASVFIALASGTPYLYGIYAPQLIQKIGLTASDSATISLATNVGTGFGGLPAGVIIDHQGPQLSILMGSICIFTGYYGLYKIYRNEVAALAAICASMTLVGFGSVLSYFATLKASQSNFPNNRGAAGAFPVSAYGLSATVFSFITHAAYSNDTGGLLRFLSFFCGLAIFLGSFFVHIYMNHEDGEDEHRLVDEESQLLRSNSEVIDDSDGPYNDSSEGDTRRSDSFKGSFSFWGIGRRTPRLSISSDYSDVPSIVQALREQNEPSDLDRLSNPVSLRHNSSTSLLKNPPINLKQPSVKKPITKNKKTPWQIIKKLLRSKLFLIHYIQVSIASGIGQTYIYSIGFVVTAQYYHDRVPEVTKNTISHIFGSEPGPASLQAVQVSIISVASFLGRFCSGFLSDLLYVKFHIQRLWIVLFTLIILACGQFIMAFNSNNYNLVSLASALTGGSYGLIFGTYPAIMADKFGTRSFSTTWGLICTGPLMTLYFLNKYLGFIYDSHSDSKTGICFEGKACYKGAFELGFALCFVAMVVSVLLIYMQRRK